MTTTTNFKTSNGTDLEYIFYPASLGGTPYSTNTGFVSGNTDLKNIFQVNGSDTTSAATTGFKLSTGADLNTVFRNINYPVLHNTDGNATLNKVNKIELTDDGNWCFCFTTDSTTGDTYVQYSVDFKTNRTFTTVLATTDIIVSCSSFNITNMFVFYILDTDINKSKINYYKLSYDGTNKSLVNQTLDLNQTYGQLLNCSVSSNGKTLAIAYYNSGSYGINFIYNSNTNVTNSSGRINTKTLSLATNVKSITCSSVYLNQGVFLGSDNNTYSFYTNVSDNFQIGGSLNINTNLLSNETTDASNNAYVNIGTFDASNNFFINYYKIKYSVTSFNYLGQINMSLSLNNYSPTLLRMFSSNNFILSYYSDSTTTGGFKVCSNGKFTNYTGQSDYTWCACSTDVNTNEIIMVACKSSGKIWYTTAINTSF